jgi:uncharacterized integral membrane protein
MKKVVVGLGALALIVIALQNPEAVETRFFFVSIMVPKVLLIVAVFLAGLVAGFLFFGPRSDTEESPPIHRALDRSREFGASSKDGR